MGMLANLANRLTKWQRERTEVDIINEDIKKKKKRIADTYKKLKLMNDPRNETNRLHKQIKSHSKLTEEELRPFGFSAGDR